MYIPFGIGKRTWFGRASGGGVNPNFIFTVETSNTSSGSSTATQFQLPLISASTVNAVVDWGDGSSDTITSYNQAETLHTYATQGEYTITISGVINGWQFNNTGDRNKILDLQNFGTFELDSTTAELQFWGCNNLVISSSDDGNYENATSFFRTWRDCNSLTSFPLIDTSSGTNLLQTWQNCISLLSFPLIDTSSVTNFGNTWQNCTSLTSFPLIDTSSGTNFSSAWSGCSSLTSFPLLDTSSGNNFDSAWLGCSSLTSFPLLDTSSGTNFYRAWRFCSSLTSFPANAFDTNIATNYGEAFLNTNLSQTSIDNILVSIDTAGQSNGTFDQSGGQGRSYNSNAAVSNLIAKGWTLTLTTPVASDEFAFTVKTDNAGTSTSTQFTIPTAGTGYLYDIETSDGQNITGLTSGTTITFPTAGTYDVFITGAFPRFYFNDSGDKLKLLELKNFGIYANGSTSQGGAFFGCSNLVISATDAGYFGSVTDFIGSFRNCTSLLSFPLIDTSSALNFTTCWFGCSSLASFPLIDTSNGTNFTSTWRGCSSLISFPLLDTTSSLTFNYCWFGCTSLSTFPANAFDTNTATIYSNSFLSTNLSTQSIDDILVSLDTCGVSNGTFNQSGGSSPSATGEAAIDSLVGKGWTITVTGGYTPPTFSLDFDTIADDFTFTRNSFATRVNESGLIETVSSDIPRIDYSTGEAAFLLEPQSTNLITYSEDFSHSSWTKGRSTITSNQITAPDNTLTADKWQMTSDFGAHYVRIGATFAGGFSNSFYVKKGNYRYIGLANSGNIFAFDFDTETIIKNTISGGVDKLSNGWYRIFTTNTWATFNYSGLYYSDASGNELAAANGDEFYYIWGAQLEEQSYATSYIPTSGTTVTRAQESSVKNNVNGLFDDNVGSIYLAYDGVLTSGTTLNNMNPFSLYGQGSNRIRLYYTPDADFLGSSVDFENGGKIAWSCNGTTILTYINGALVDTHTITSNFTTLTNFILSTPFMTHRINDIKIYDKALTDAQLIELTTI